MEVAEHDIITGHHSIYHALINPKRKPIKVLATQKGLDEFRKKYKKLTSSEEVEVCKPHDFQEKAKKLFSKHNFNFSRISSGLVLEAKPLDFKGNAWLYDQVEKKEKIKLLALDQVTDVHNAAAIVRTAAFYQVDALIVATKGTFKLTPNFFRVSSGGFEYTPFVQVSSLAKTLNKLRELSVKAVGFSEESSETDVALSSKYCLVLGAEDTGLSHAVERNLDYNISLKTDSPLNSLNVSVATAIALERCRN